MNLNEVPKLYQGSSVYYYLVMHGALEIGKLYKMIQPGYILYTTKEENRL